MAVNSAAGARGATVVGAMGNVPETVRRAEVTAVVALREVKYVQNIGRFEKGQSVAGAAFGPCTLVFGCFRN